MGNTVGATHHICNNHHASVLKGEDVPILYGIEMNNKLR